MKYTTNFSEAKKICKPFARLKFPRNIAPLLSDYVLYYFPENDSSFICWPYFPVRKNRIVVKEMKEEGVIIPESVKVIIESRTSNEVEEYMLDAFGHTILYLINTRASNECEDAMRTIEEFGIYYI